ncbi:MAG: DUF58 domain-containing protein [Blastopirellula sp.]|nr:MAG: DUF58 domain-containing protein [Blastopirellula sp.]
MRWLVGSLLLLLIATVFQLGLLVYSMYALLVVMLGSRWLTIYWAENLTVLREINRETVEQGEQVAVVVTVRNRGQLPVPWFLLEDLLQKSAIMYRPASLQVSGRRLFLAMMRGNSTKRFSYQIKCNRRGYYQIGPTVIETGDLFGLHRKFKVGAAPDYLMVLPEVVPLDGFDIASRRPIGEIRMTHRLFEDPTRIAGVRQYQPGDPMNRVNWAATARTGVLHSKVFEPSSIAGVTILLDFHQDSFDPKHEPIRSELAITLSAAIANSLQLMGQQIGLVTNARDAAERIKSEGWDFDARSRKAAQKAATVQTDNARKRPQIVETKRGAEQFSQILEVLARAEKNDGLTLPELITETASRMPRDATVIVILTKVTDEMALSLGNLRRIGFAVTAMINIYDEYDYAKAAGKLLSEGIMSRQLHDPDNIHAICGPQAYSLF